MSSKNQNNENKKYSEVVTESDTSEDSCEETDQNSASKSEGISEEKNFTDLKASEKKNTNNFYYHPTRLNDSMQTKKKEALPGKLLSWRDPDYSYVRQGFGINYKNQKDRHFNDFNHNWRVKNSPMNIFESHINSSNYKNEWRIKHGIVKYGMDSKKINSFSSTSKSFSEEHEWYSVSQKSSTFKKKYNEKESPYLMLLENPSEGFWAFSCDCEKSKGAYLSEFDSIWQTMQEIFIEKPGLFSRKPMKYPIEISLSQITCFTKTWHDKEQVSNIMNILRKKLHYPYVTYYLSNFNGNIISIYMSTCEGDMYEREEKAWKLANFEKN